MTKHDATTVDFNKAQYDELCHLTQKSRSAIAQTLGYSGSSSSSWFALGKCRESVNVAVKLLLDAEKRSRLPEGKSLLDYKEPEKVMIARVPAGKAKKVVEFLELMDIKAKLV